MSVTKLTCNRPHNPLRVLGEFLLQKSAELEKPLDKYGYPIEEDAEMKDK